MVVMLTVAATGVALAQGDLLRRGKDLLPGAAGAGAGSAAGLSASQADAGLREALKVAAQRTVAKVGRTDGYLKDPAIHIPLPGFLQSAKQAAGAVGASGLLDDLELRINRAAEAAAPKAGGILADAISGMSVSDARAIVTGPDDAATQYLKRTSTAPLTQAFRPVVDSALADAGAVKAYQAATQRVASSSPLGKLGGIAGGSSGSSGFDLTDFVVDRALQGIFHYVGQEEAAIRTNPAARSTDLLKQVFGR
jgi:hypothetical protein